MKAVTWRVANTEFGALFIEGAGDYVLITGPETTTVLDDLLTEGKNFHQESIEIVSLGERPNVGLIEDIAATAEAFSGVPFKCL